MNNSIKLFLGICIFFNTFTFGQYGISPSIIEDCDNINFIPRTSKQSFITFLTGVKYAVIEDYSNSNSQIMKIKYSLVRYLQNMGFQVVEKSREDLDKTELQCDETFVAFGIKDYSNSVEISLIFYSCLADEYSFKTTKLLEEDGGIINNTKPYFYNAFVKMNGKKKPVFSSYSTLKSAKSQTCWNEETLKKAFKNNGCDIIEGIYESSKSSNKMAKYKLAVKKINSVYYLIYLSGAQNTSIWDEGEIKAILEPTATPLLFRANWFMANKSENSNYYITFEQGLFNLLSDDNEKILYIKMFPLSSDNISSSPSEGPSSGTGYAITSSGYIVTNHHVTNGATKIKIRGINGDFSKTYSAKVIIEDKNNDLSIIKIDDPNFTTLGSIPYVISNRSSDVGSSVFVLGYPLRATMGDEVKLTNGIISSKTGFQGDVTTYQITAPVQPGNSGGPLFDYKGNVIGIINAKHVGAENATYAIKASYLLNLVDLMQVPPMLQTVSSVAGKPLTEQVKILKKFTYIIEIN